MTILAQTTTTTIPSEVEIVEPSRPLSEYLIDLFNLDPNGPTAAVLNSVIEPIVQIVLTFVIAWLFLRIVRSFGRKFIDRAKQREMTVAGGDGAAPMPSSRTNQRLEALSAVFNSILALVVWSAAVLIILGSTFGVDITPFLAGAGVIGIAVGFGAQDLVKDFVSGVFMLIEDQYGVGDVVDVGDATGVVERISLRSTRLRDVTGTVWHVPNGEIRRVGNMSQEWSRALLDIGVGYGSDIDQASEVIRSVADQMAAEDAYRYKFLAPPEVWGVESVGPDAVVIRLVIKTVPGEQWGISRELRRRIKDGLDHAGIQAPLAQRPMWVRHPGEDQANESSLERPAATGKGGWEDGDSGTADE